MVKGVLLIVVGFILIMMANSANSGNLPEPLESYNSEEFKVHPITGERSYRSEVDCAHDNASDFYCCANVPGTDKFVVRIYTREGECPH